MKALSLFFLPAFLLTVFGIQAQTIPIHPSKVIKGFYTGPSKAIRDLPVMTARDWNRRAGQQENELNEDSDRRSNLSASRGLHKGTDRFFKGASGSLTNNDSILVNFDSQTSAALPPLDCNGAAGPNHFVQTISGSFAIYSRTGQLLAGPIDLIYLFTGLPGGDPSYPWIDPITLYDEQADRWLMACFSFSRADSASYMLIAISATNDPLGDWYPYSFQVDYFPDYPKFGIWRDGYYMADNRYWLPVKGSHSGDSNDTYVFHRDRMLNGDQAEAIAFFNAYKPISSDTSSAFVPPVHNVGDFAPAGSPGIFIGLNKDTSGVGSDQLWIYELHVDWNNIPNSTLNRIQQIDVQPFSSDFGPRYLNIIQPDDMNPLDAVPHILMNVPQYRNFGSYQNIVCCHTVNLSSPYEPHAGIRWYELRKIPGGDWTIRQQNTYCPDDDNRWMGSIMLNGQNQIALAYSVTGVKTNPSIRFCGQNRWSYLSGNSTLDIAEDTIVSGKYTQTYMHRWGEYALMSVDPTDDNTFWFTTEYIGPANLHKTRVASFNFNIHPIVITKPATGITPTSAILNGSVNPNGLATTCHFEYGNTTSYGNNTPYIQAGSGIATLETNGTLTGLISGTTYHFHLVGTNSAGTSNGIDMFFTPGAAVLTTLPVTSVTLTTAFSGGIITSDGSFDVTGRGTCWSSDPNPTISGNHTTDGSGTGLFNSSIGGLSSNTLYHIRAYATNSAGTWYGNDISFTTLCKTYSFPFTETFDKTSIPQCWTQIDNMGNGQFWQFGTITDEDQPPNLIGNYAYINSDDYGSGSQDAGLVSPQLNCSSYTNVVLEFDHYYKTRYYPERSLSYSIDAGLNWTLLQTFDYELPSNPTRFSQLIPEVAGKSAVKFRWNFTASYDLFWALDNVQVKSTTGIDESGTEKVNIFPNPNKGIFNLVPTEGKSVEIKLNVFDISGRMILKQTLKGASQYQVDLSSAAEGAVIMVIQTNTWLITRKIVIIR